MKRILILLLALVMCMGCFFACDKTPAGNEDTTAEDTAAAATLTDAVKYLRSIYKDSAKETPADYDVVGKVVIGTTEFAVTWTTDNADITVKVSEKNAAFYTIDLPAKNDTVVDYKLTGTVTDAAGQTESVSFDRTLPVYDSSAIVDKPEEGVAYKFYMIHTSLGQTLFATGETQDGGNKFILSTTDPKAAPDFYVEADGEGFKFYTELNGVKTYLYAKTTTSDDGKVSKYVGYSTEQGTTWTYKSETNGWYTTIDGVEYVVGTYGTYNTFCISESTHLTVENSGKTQVPGGLMLKDVAEAMTPSAGPTIYETPEEIVNAVYDLEIGGVLSGGHKYTLTGVITSIPSAWSDDYGNITVVIVVGDMTDKPIECFRLKGEGANNLMVGDTITVTGELLKYNNNTETGKVEFNAGCTLDSGNFCNHTNETIPGKAATCTEAGITDGQKCTTCGKTTVEQTTIEALGHDWNAVLANDSSNHWTACTRCTEIKDKAAHNNGNDSVCDTCGYGCEHKNAPAATCGAASVCPSCGTTLATATGNHTFDNDMDATCNGCDFTREVKEMVVFYCPKDSKYITGNEYFYSAKSKMELTLSADKADAIAMEKITNADGSVSFMADGKYLFCDGTHVEFVSTQSDNTKFVIEDADGGVYVRCFSANYNGKPQYLEVYSGYMTCYSMTTTVADFLLVIESADGANGTVKDDANSKVDNAGGSSSEQPSTGVTTIPNGVDSVATGKNYKLAAVNASGNLFFDGTLTNGRINGNATGVTVQLEAGAAAGEYYIYFMDGSTKTYLGVNSTLTENKTAGFVLSTEKNDDCVWVIDASAKTIISKTFTGRGIATQSNSTYSNFSTYSTTNLGVSPYVFSWFVAA